jgi:hypothetical protein
VALPDWIDLLNGPQDFPPRHFLVLTAYLDESGHEGKEHVFIAGFIGNDEQWRECAKRWALGLGKKKSLHMNRLRWKNQRTKKLLARLGPIPEGCGLQRVVGGVRVRDYEDLIVGTPAEKIAKGYYTALYPLVIRILRWVPADERVKLVFEEQREYEAYTGSVLSSLANGPDPKWRTTDGLPKLAEWAFVPKGSTTLTEPSDYLAYALLQNYRDKTSERANWCMPILGGLKFKAIGRVMRRMEIRALVVVTQMLVEKRMRKT